jgi:hypothetical protein
MSVPLPSLPTDNLYKFMAISGLVLLVAGIVVPWQYIAREGDMIDALRYQSELITLQVQQVETDFGREQQRHQPFLDAVISGKVALSPGNLERAQEIFKDAVGLMDRRRKADAAMAEFRASLAKASRADATTNRMLLLGTASRALGLLLFVFGFGLWYFKAQRLQDRLLALEVRTAEKDLLRALQDIRSEKAAADVRPASSDVAP